MPPDSPSLPSHSSPVVAVLGAGPAGLIAAEVLAAAGCRVTIYDRMPSPARKFLMAGRGGLNLTHSEALDRFLTRYGPATDWLTPAIRAFPPDHLRQWCEDLGQPTFVGSSGRLFPTAMKAAPLLRAWLGRLDRLGVRFRFRHQWLGWQGKALLFTDADGRQVEVTADATLLALGGASWPRLGSDGGWVKPLTGIGVDVVPLRPANVGFRTHWSENFRQRFAGQPLKPVTVTHQARTQQGEAMITAEGIEGGVIYALSSDLRQTLERNGTATLQLDLRPQLSREALTQKLDKTPARKSFSTRLRGLGFAPLAIALLRELAPPDALHDTARLAEAIKALPLTLTGTGEIARAISSAGGIPRQAVTADFMLHARPGAFVAGEMLDWEAPTGGYLLQACFSTAVAAAEGMLRYLGHPPPAARHP